MAWLIGDLGSLRLYTLGVDVSCNQLMIIISAYVCNTKKSEIS